MAGIPDIFGGPHMAAASKAHPKVGKESDRTQKRQKHTGKKQKMDDVSKDPPAAHDSHAAPDSQVGAANKPSLSRVFKEVGKIGDSLLSETEYKKWMAKSQEQKLAHATRASLELLLFNTEQSQANKNNLSRIKGLEDEITKLKISVKDAKTKAATLEATNNNLQEDLARQIEYGKGKDKTIADLEEKVTELQLEVEENEATNVGEEEKDLIKKEAFGEGIRTYCKTFLAGDPSYDWRAKFGSHMAGYMADLAEKEAESIAAKRIELETMVANETAELARQSDLARQSIQPTDNQDKTDGNEVATS